jgi:hypothetical protein
VSLKSADKVQISYTSLSSLVLEGYAPNHPSLLSCHLVAIYSKQNRLEDMVASRRQQCPPKSRPYLRQQGQNFSHLGPFSSLATEKTTSQRTPSSQIVSAKTSCLTSKPTVLPKKSSRKNQEEGRERQVATGYSAARAEVNSAMEKRGV